MKIKICGTTIKENLDFYIKNNIDFVGMIFYEKSPRFISLENAVKLTKNIKNIKKVGVFVNSDVDTVINFVNTLKLDLVQLHGFEDINYCKKIKKKNIKIIKVFRINKENHNEIKTELNKFNDVVDYFLFDTKLNKEFGGTGKTFDWNILNNLNITKPYFLSGGLNENNLKKALQTTKPYCIDLNSGLETSPGIKSHSKIENILKIINNDNRK